MRLFKSSNKSQASLERLSGSRDHSPTQQPDPTYSQAQAYGGAPSAVYSSPQYQQQHPQQQSLQYRQQQSQQPESYYTEDQPQQHPAHFLNRRESNRAASGVGDSYVQDQQPTVNIVPPGNIHAPQPPYHQGPAKPGQSQQVRTEKEPKKSKRNLFGVLSKREDKEEGGDRRSVGRASSILKNRGPQSPTQQQQHSPRAPSLQYPDSRPSGLDERFSSENSPQEPPNYNPYQDSPDQYRSQEHFDSPQSQHTRQSVQYIEDSRYQNQHPHQPGQPAHDRQFPIYQLRESANNSENNLSHQGPRPPGPSYDTNQSLRPPSQTSLGPPSPLGGQQHHDSRPSTSNTQPQRFSSQSQRNNPVQSQQPQLQHQNQPPSQQQQSLSLPPSQQPTPQPTPLLSAQTQSVDQDQQSSGQAQFVNNASNMPRNDGTNGRRHDDHLYSQQDPRVRTQSHEQITQGRSTPPPNRGKEDFSSLDYSQLLAKHEELQAKYSKVKRYYFERDAQVTQLQNTVATQRLSMSKTSLDDAGYTTRFDRLNGAIQNLSFNIRKDWRRVPNWLAPVCNRDAHTVGTKEMTAVGRACTTRWLYEYVFERVFHPGIDPILSAHLKGIERTLRRGHYGMLTSEQQDDLLTKITTWRLTTVEGLQDVLGSRQAEVYTESLIMGLSKQLETYLRAFLVDPPPPGLSDGLTSIVGQAIGIVQNIPLESRDICIEYFMPGAHIAETYMRIEPGMTVLSHPGSAPTASDALPGNNDSDEQLSASSSQQDGSNLNVEDAIRESAKAASALGQGPSAQRNEAPAGVPTGASKLSHQASSTSSKEKKGFLGGFVNKRPTHASSSRADHDNSKSSDNGPADHAYNIQSITGGTTENKIRFAAFLAVEVRGRGVLKETGKDGDKGSLKDVDDKKDGSGSVGGAGASSAATGVQKSGGSGMGTNILCKAPVYAFE